MKAIFSGFPKPLFEFICFLCISGIALFSYRLLYYLKGPSLFVVSIIFLLIMLLFYRKLYFAMPLVRNSTTFYLILFFTYPLIYYQQKMTGLSFPGLNGIIPFLVFFIITIALKIKIGFPEYVLHLKMDRFSLSLLPFMAAISATALVLWVTLLHPDLTAFITIIPRASWPVLFLFGILFTLSNAFAEEMLFRGFLFDGLSAFIHQPAFVISLQAICFGIWHFHGFPGGIVGSMMVFVWALFLGAMRYRSKSIWYPIIGHIFADLTIFVILLHFSKRNFT